jgi:hypothetical protein
VLGVLTFVALTDILTGTFPTSWRKCGRMRLSLSFFSMKVLRAGELSLSGFQKK